MEPGVLWVSTGGAVLSGYGGLYIAELDSSEAGAVRGVWALYAGKGLGAAGVGGSTRGAETSLMLAGPITGAHAKRLAGSRDGLHGGL